MPMNRYGEIIRNSSSPAPILPNNHSGNNGPEKKNAFYIILGSLVLVVIVAFLAKTVLKKDYYSTDDHKEVVVQNTEKQYDEKPVFDYSNNGGEAFYGIWTYASKELNLAQVFADEFDVDGYNGIVFLTSEWENLNQDDWYAVSIGIYYSKEDAESILAIVKKKYSDAYIKYSGNYKK